MKTFLVLIFIGFIQLISAQQAVPVGHNDINNPLDIQKLPEPSAENDDIKVFKSPEIKSEFPGGQGAFFKFVSKNFVIPENAGESVKVFVTFIIEKDGSLSDIKVLRDTGYGTGKEALRVLKTSPKWKPAMNNGKFVRSEYMFPISILNRKDAKSDDNIIYNTAGVDVKPDFPGGLAAFYKFVDDNFVQKSDPKIDGKIFVTFIIEKDGSLTDIKIIRDVGYGTSAETLRVLKLSPKWNPAEKDFKKVRVLYSLPLIIHSK